MSGIYTPVQGLILLAYNAYYNRFLKYEASLQDYLDNSEGSDYLIQNVNFNPADGLNTIHVAGNGELDNRLEFRDYSFTYALLIEYNPANKTREEIYADEDTRILSKWFILDNDRTRGGQYRLSLRRDVLVDYMKQIKKSPIFVEKGIINDYSNPLLMNNEDVKVNQIKKQEILLKDRTECPWLVLFLKKGVVGNNSIDPITVNVTQNEDFVYETLTTPIAQWQYFDYTTTDYLIAYQNKFRVRFKKYDDEANVYEISDNDPYPSTLKFTFYNAGTNLKAHNSLFTPSIKENLDSSYGSIVGTTLRSQFLTAFNYKGTDPISKYNDKIIKDSQGKFFRVRVYQNSSGTSENNITSSNAPALKSSMNNAWNSANGGSTDSANNNAFSVTTNWRGLRIELLPLEDINTTITMGDYTGKGTQDSPLFDVICMPYGAVKFYGSGGLIDIDSNALRSMAIMSSIATALTSEYVLDFQILPYCPAQGLINPTIDKRMKISYLHDSCLEAIYSGSTTDLIIVCESANFTFDINKEIEIPNFDDVPDYMRVKYLNDCTLIRLCSPNYNGLFEMNIAKNGGKISKFNVDMTLRPFNPYIHVNPDFEYLYGTDFNDVRGLVCGGDFSLGIINDAWNVYEIQNKNYQAIFDRQIQNLDINQSIARQEAGWGIAAGVISGTASGAAGGAVVGGGWGALAGAVIGGGSSAVGGALDWMNLEKRQQEARSFAIDNYNLQLGNVRALPYSITKTSALTYNNKLFPFVEIYECSEVEKEAYYNKIYWNGMTVGIIDRLPNYESGNWANYFRGKLIALHGEEGSNAVENRIIEAINVELMKGVFI